MRISIFEQSLRFWNDLVEEVKPLQEPKECQNLPETNKNPFINCPEPLLFVIILVRWYSVHHSERHDKCVENVNQQESRSHRVVEFLHRYHPIPKWTFLTCQRNVLLHILRKHAIFVNYFLIHPNFLQIWVARVSSKWLGLLIFLLQQLPQLVSMHEAYRNQHQVHQEFYYVQCEVKYSRPVAWISVTIRAEDVKAEVCRAYFQCDQNNEIRCREYVHLSLGTLFLFLAHCSKSNVNR